MASRPVWEGHLRLSLVACLVRLFKATGEGDAVHFHLLHRQTLNRVKQQYRDPEDGVVERRDMVKGYEIERDRYVVVEDEEPRSSISSASSIVARSTGCTGRSPTTSSRAASQHRSLSR
jgi:DNA end-binding protein Ku